MSRRVCLPAGARGHIAENRRIEDHPPEHQLGCKTTGRTPCGDEPERTMPPCSPFGARMQWPEPAQHRAEPGAQLRLTKGGAVRTRIALSTALAVLVVVPVLLFALSSSSPDASARTRHEAGSRYEAARIDVKLMSYAQAEKVTKLVTFYNAVTAQEEETYFKEIAYIQAIAAEQSAAAAASRAQAVTAPPPDTAGGDADASSTATPDWVCIRQHESGGNYTEGGGGAYQFQLGTWEGLTGLSTPPQDSPPAVQDAAALRLYAERGWEPWTTRYVCGL
jgi:hypothetical protein